MRRRGPQRHAPTLCHSHLFALRFSERAFDFARKLIRQRASALSADQYVVVAGRRIAVASSDDVGAEVAERFDEFERVGLCAFEEFSDIDVAAPFAGETVVVVAKSAFESSAHVNDQKFAVTFDGGPIGTTAETSTPPMPTRSSQTTNTDTPSMWNQ